MDSKRIDFTKKKTELEEYDRILWEIKEELGLVAHETLAECIQLARLTKAKKAALDKPPPAAQETIESLLRESKDENVQALLAVVRTIREFVGEKEE